MFKPEGATEVAEGVKKAISNTCNIFFIIFISFFILYFIFINCKLVLPVELQ